MRNVTHRWPQLGHFPPKLGHFFQFLKKGRRDFPLYSNAPKHRIFLTPNNLAFIFGEESTIRNVATKLIQLKTYGCCCCLPNVNNKNSRQNVYEIYLNYCCRSGVFIANFERISNFFLVFSIVSVGQINVYWLTINRIRNFHPTTKLEIQIWHGCFPVNFAKFSK